MLKKTLLIIFTILVTVTFTTGYTTKTPRTLYHVYLKGKSLGIIKSKKSLEAYIDKKQQSIKEKYGVDKVYVPDDLSIVKETTYDAKVISTEKIYEKIKDISPFTIEGYAIKINGLDTKDSDGKKIKGKNLHRR